MVRGSDRVTPTDRVGVSGDGQRADTRFRLESPRRRVQVPQLLVAVLLVALSALAALVLFSQASARDAVLALANPVERGQVVATEDFSIVYVGTDDPVTTVPADRLSSLVGLTAVADLEAGTIVTPAHFVARSVLAEGEAVVGVALSPGEYPTPRLAAGDLVDVIRVESGAGDGGVLVAAVEVFDITELGTQGDQFISLRMPSAAAAGVAQAAATDNVRLVLVGAGEG